MFEEDVYQVQFVPNTPMQDVFRSIQLSSVFLCAWCQKALLMPQVKVLRIDRRILQKLDVAMAFSACILTVKTSCLVMFIGHL